jgi:hypothetical protein
MCNEARPISEFRSRGGSMRHLIKSRCNHCLYLEHRRWSEENPDSVREYRSRHKWTLKKRCNRHDISVEDFWSIYENQDGVCPICENDIDPEDSAIDHNHETGNVRGLLCKTCNRGLGMLKDSERVLHNAIDYIRQNGSYGS